MTTAEESNGIEITPPDPNNDPSTEEGNGTEPTIEGNDDNNANEERQLFNNESITILSADEIKNVGQPTGEDNEPFIDTPQQVAAKGEPGSTTNLSDDKKKEVMKAFATEFQEAGLLSEDFNLEEFDGTLEGLKEQVGKKESAFMNKYQESYAENFSGAKKRFLEIEDAFTDESHAMSVAKDLEFYTTVSDDQIESDENIARALYGKLLASRGFNETQIAEEIEDKDALGKLTDAAKDALPLLKGGAEQYVENSRTRKAAMEQQAADQAKQTFTDMLTSVDDREFIIKDLPFNKNHKEKIKNKLTNSVYTDDSGRNYTSIGHKQISNPREFEILMAYYDELGLFDIDGKTGKFKPNLSKIKTVTKTKASREIDDIISDADVRQSNNISGGSPLEGQERTSSILSLLKDGFTE